MGGVDGLSVGAIEDGCPNEKGLLEISLPGLPPPLKEKPKEGGAGTGVVAPKLNKPPFFISAGGGVFGAAPKENKVLAGFGSSILLTGGLMLPNENPPPKRGLGVSIGVVLSPNKGFETLGVDGDDAVPKENGAGASVLGWSSLNSPGGFGALVVNAGAGADTGASPKGEDALGRSSPKSLEGAGSVTFKVGIGPPNNDCNGAASSFFAGAANIDELGSEVVAPKLPNKKGAAETGGAFTPSVLAVNPPNIFVLPDAGTESSFLFSPSHKGFSMSFTGS